MTTTRRGSGQMGLALAMGALLLSLSVGSVHAEEEEGSERTVVLWHSYRGAEKQALERVIRGINETRGDLRIQPLAVPHDGYANKLTSAIPRGHGPDLFIYAHERIGGWADGGLLMRLDARVDRSELDRFFTETVDPLRYEGALYGLPMDFKSTVLFYNTELVDEPPETTEELLELARRLTDAEGGRYGLVYETTSFYHHTAWLHGFGGAIIDEGGEVRLDSAENASSLAFARDLVLRHRVCPEETSGALVTQLFNEGRAAMVINGPWFLGEIGDDVPYAVSVLPVVTETGQRARPLLTSEAILMASGARDPEAALEAMLLLVGTDSAVTRAVEGRQAVATRAAWQDQRVAADRVLAVFREQLPETVAMSNRAEMRSVWEPAQMAMRQIMRGAADPAVALETAQHHYRVLVRPPPPEANVTPYAAAAAVLLLVVVVLFVRRARQTDLSARLAEGKHAFGYIAPMAVAVIGLVFLPFIVATGVSLFAHRGGEFTFVGLRNFLWILTARDFGVTDPMSFYFTLLVTVLWTAVNVLLHVTIGVALAMLMRNIWKPVRGIYRVLLIIPWAVPNYITALIWRGMFHRQFGAINGLLDALGLEPVGWFSGFWTALAANITTNTWLGFPFMMVVTLGALQAIPKDLEEAAEVDGAGRFARFRHVTLPLLRPALLPAVVLGSVWTFNMFNIVYLVSGGEPDGASEILISEAYRWAFSRQEQYGYASAYGVLVFFSLLLYSRLVRKVTGEGKA